VRGPAIERVADDRVLAERTHGVMNLDGIELASRTAEPHVQRMNMILTTAPNEEAARERITEMMDEGYTKVVRNIYGGNEQAFEAGIDEINQVLDALPEGVGENLRQQIDEFCLTIDPAVHLQILGIARAVNRVVARGGN